MRIKETVIVEGRDDTTAVKRAVDVETIETHGFGIKTETWQLIKKAADTTGIIIFTDPDHAGEAIRERLAERYPEAKHAHLSRNDALKDGDVGIENAMPEDICEALSKAGAMSGEFKETFSAEDMRKNGLSGSKESSEKRRFLGKQLGIGYGNSKSFLRKLNRYNIQREDFDEALRAEKNSRNGGRT